MIRSLLIYAALTLALSSYAKAKPVDIDSQFWGEVDLKAILDGVEVTALGVMRRSANLPNPAFNGAGLVLGTDLDEAWSVEAGDLWVRAKLAPDRFVNVDAPLVAASYRWRFGDFKLSDRQRFEKLTGIPGEPWRYRNRLDALYPIELGPVHGIVASDEVFYNFGVSAWSRNRAQLGLALASKGPAMLTITYLRQDDRFSAPTGINAVCATLVITLP